MSDRHVIGCDACGAETGLYEADGWLQVRTYVASYAYMEHIQQMRHAEGELDDGTNHGDFCSLVCLANWASARANLRDLEEPRE